MKYKTVWDIVIHHFGRANNYIVGESIAFVAHWLNGSFIVVASDGLPIADVAEVAAVPIDLGATPWFAQHSQRRQLSVARQCADERERGQE